ncbi:MAG: TlpA disulfide reductase family protein [Maribacter sp.]|uniref:redoxin domain-containing protein n=1 Tax=Maribacter sp. 2307UL18-2 TaxID=3386274 RepID=UPI0039BC31E0
MRKIVLPLLLMALVVACNSKPEGYELSGELRGELEEGTEVFLKKIGPNKQPLDVDTTTIKSGKFLFTGVQDLPEMHFIFVGELPGYSTLILENGEINYSAQKDSLGFAEVKGSMQNKSFSDYMKGSRAIADKAKSVQQDLQSADEATRAALQDEMQELQEEYKNFDVDYIKGHPDALISVLLMDRAIASRQMTYEELKGMFDAFTPQIKETTDAKRIAEQLEALKDREEKSKSTEVGAKAPEFTAPGPNGEQVALNEVLGKVTLVDFWAAWCRPCRAENPNVVSVYKKYHDKGLNILGVSLDRKAEDWKKAIADDELTWNHVSHVQYFNDPVAKLYNVDAIPAAFLLDENGVIVAKNLRGPALEEKVAELLN